MNRGQQHAPVRQVRAWHGQLPVDNTPVGDQVKNNFVANLLAILGDCRFLLLYDGGDTTATTDLSRIARTFDHDASIAGSLGQLGSGLFRSHDGTSDESDTVDTADTSFGDGANDQPFSIIALVLADDETPAAAMEIVAKWNLDTDGELREYRFFLTGTNGYPTMEIYDESANAFIGRQDQTALTVSTWTLLGGTYDGSEANTGISIFVDAALLDDADSSSGTFVAMEDTTTKVAIAHSLSALSTPVAELFWGGDIALVAMTAKELTIDEMWQIKELVNGFFDLSL